MLLQPMQTRWIFGLGLPSDFESVDVGEVCGSLMNTF